MVLIILLTRQVLSDDEAFKTYHYQIDTPVAASQIGLAVGYVIIALTVTYDETHAISPFEYHADPDIANTTHFCLPGLKPLMMHTVDKYKPVRARTLLLCVAKPSSDNVTQAMRLFEDEVFRCRPFSTHKLIFVDEVCAL